MEGLFVAFCMNAQESAGETMFFYRAGSVLLFLCLCGSETQRETYMDTNPCNRALGKYSSVQHEMLILRSVGSHVIDRKTNLEHALTLIQCLNVSVSNKSVRDNRCILFTRKIHRAGYTVGLFQSGLQFKDAACTIFKYKCIRVETISR